MNPLIQLRGVVAGYPLARGRFHKAVDGVSLTVRQGEILGLMGESGCGKTTLGKVVAGLALPRAGTLFWEGQSVPFGLRREIQMVFQDSAASLNPRLPVSRLVEEGLVIRGSGTAAQRKARVLSMLREVGLDEALQNRYPHQLSGGQRQRVSLARTLIVAPRLVILDEPVSALDTAATLQMLELLAALGESKGLSFLFISHHMAAVRQACARTAVMYLGKIVECGPVASLFYRPAHPYTRLLLDCYPRPEPGYFPLPPAGDVPDPLQIPPGCRFHPRCPRAASVCRRMPPAAENVTDGHRVACHRPLA
jgi:oligopeptide transport system ATP-binding protein